MSPDDPGPVDALFFFFLNIVMDGRTFSAAQLGQNRSIGHWFESQTETLKMKLRMLALSPCEKVKNLGVIFESNIGTISMTAFYHLKNIARVRPFLSQANTETLIHAFITSRIDYCNSLLSGLPKNKISKLQLVQNAAAHLLTKTKTRTHITPILKSLHWLPVNFRTAFKILLLL